MKGMILAAGLGTRLKPFTDKHPKALATVNGKTLLQRNVEYLHSHGVDEIIVNVHHFADQIVDEIKRLNIDDCKISISDETAEVLETGGGLKKAADFFTGSKEPFVLMNVDILSDLNITQMKDFHLQNNPLATLAVTDRNTSRYLLFTNENTLCGWLNDKTGEQKGLTGNKKAFSGIHMISPEIFPLIKEVGKFSMVGLYLRLAKENTIKAFDHSGSKFIDVGKPESIEKAERMFV